MKNINNLIFIISILFFVQLNGQDFSHPGAMHSKKDLDFVKSKIQSNQEPWKTAYNSFLTAKANPYKKAYSDPNYQHNAYETVECGFFNNPNVGCNDMVYDGIAAYSLALRFYFTDDARYAAKSIEIINAWSLKYRSNEDLNSRLVVSWATPWYVNAAEILKYTNNSGWNTTNTNRLNTMLNRFKDYIFWEGRPNNNWRMSAIEARLAIAIFQNDRGAFNSAVSAWKQRIKTYIYQTTDGSRPINPAGENNSHTAGVWRSDRSGTVYINGLCMETCRDLNHTKLGFFSLVYGAELAWNQGVDLFQIEEKRIADFLELHSNWMMGGNVPNNICDGYLDKVEEDGFEVAYSHISDRLGRNLPKTKQMNNRNRPTGPISGWVKKWETLMYANRSFNLSPSNDDIASLSAPTAVQRGNNVSVNVNYSASTNRDIYVIFQLDQSPWTGYAQQKRDVSAGSGTLTFNLNIPPNTPVANNNYQFQTFITTNGGGWDQRLDNIARTNVDVVNGGSSNNELSEGVYRFQNVSDNRSMDSDGFSIKLNNWSGNNDQKWSLVATSDGYYNIDSRHSGRGVLDTDDDGVVKGLTIEPVIANAGAEWKPVKLSNGNYRFENRNASRKYLRYNGNNSIIGYANTADPRSEWKLTRLDELRSSIEASDEKVSGISIHPNPSMTGVFNLSTKILFQVYSINGKLVYEGYSDRVDLSEFSKGIYILRSKNLIIKLVK